MWNNNIYNCILITLIIKNTLWYKILDDNKVYNECNVYFINNVYFATNLSFIYDVNFVKTTMNVPLRYPVTKYVI